MHSQSADFLAQKAAIGHPMGLTTVKRCSAPEAHLTLAAAGFALRDIADQQ
jgi:hypothetical protein